MFLQYMQIQAVFKNSRNFLNQFWPIKNSLGKEILYKVSSIVIWVIYFTDACIPYYLLMGFFRAILFSTGFRHQCP